MNPTQKRQRDMRLPMVGLGHAVLRKAARLFTEGFSTFLRRRRVRRHFSRSPMLHALAAGKAPPPGDLPGAGLLRAAQASPEELVSRLGTSLQGLTVAAAAQRLLRDGPNEVAHEKPLAGWRRLWQCYLNPFNVLLTVLGVLSWLSGDAKAMLVVSFMVLLSTFMRFIQEGRSHKAAESLSSLVGNTATVLRRTDASNAPTASEVPVRVLVAGDMIILSAGDMIPADCRILAARDLFVAQAAMTGESAPVEKFTFHRGASPAPLEETNLVYMGTSVVSGAATALVLETGPRTYFGTLAVSALATEAGPDAFQAGVNSVSWLLIRFGAVIVPFVFLINGASKGNWLDAFLFALSVAVGLTPEMLPMIVTSTLARGAVSLSKRKVVVKRLDAIQNLGAMDVLCMDKTGTLTQDKVAVASVTDAYGAASPEVLNLAFLNSYYQTGLKNLLDHAVLAHLEVAIELKLEDDYSKIDEIPFDFERRRMSVVVAERNHHHELICKGAVEEVLAICTHVQVAPDKETAGPAAAVLDAGALERIEVFIKSLSTAGFRVIAVAMKELPPTQTVYTVADEAGLTLIGFISFLDPPKETAASALAALSAHGIVVKVLTGDNEFVAAHVCSQVGLEAGPVLLGTHIETMGEAGLREAVVQHHLFAKLAPLHKERIVRALRGRGNIVGFLGDGINDAPALRAADVGISVDTAVDIAKEAADIILLEKSLLVLDEGVVIGRVTFANMLKYIRMTASSNFGNVLSVLIASALLPFLPMLPLQLLVQNLLYDVAQTGIPFDRVDPELVVRPLKWTPKDIGRFMLFFGPVSSVFDVATFGVMWWLFEANTVARQALFQSGWFVVGLLTQTMVVHLIRTPKLPFVQSRAAAPLLTMTFAIFLIGVWLPNGILAPYLKLSPLPVPYYVWLAAILTGYFFVATLMKRFYISRYGWQ